MYNQEESQKLISPKNEGEETAHIQKNDICAVPGNFSCHFLSGILSLIFLPHFLFLTIPALVFSKRAKGHLKKGNASQAIHFANKSRRFIITAWLLTFVLLALLSLFVATVIFCL